MIMDKDKEDEEILLAIVALEHLHRGLWIVFLRTAIADLQPGRGVAHTGRP
jgi:hypothetical protein